MEENKKASISVNLETSNLEIFGSEEFVERNLKFVLDFWEKNKIGMLSASKMVPMKEVEEGTCMSAETIDAVKTTTVQTDKYISGGIYHIDQEDGTISILKTIPGSNKAEKIKNITLIVLYIKKGKITSKELVPICEKHACYDSANFASYMKKEKTNWIYKGKGQAWTVELTHPGEQAAETLLEEMLNAEK